MRPVKCVICGGIHDRCEFGLGLECVRGDDCTAPHHRSPAGRIGLCSRCAGVIFVSDPVVVTRRGTEHERCHRKAAGHD
jgi:hypothetical protein